MHPLVPDGNLYRILMVLALGVSFLFWLRRSRENRALPYVFLGAVLGGFTGAKLVYILAEGWLHFGEPNLWLHLATGKTIVGALLGGYLGIEIAKAGIGYRKATGDWFAIVVPLGIAAGRIGCLVQGCCAGIPLTDDAWYALADRSGEPRWPAPVAELIFNLVAVAILLPLRRSPGLKGQLFHLYLVAYGTFRFLHEFLRDTPKPFAGLSGYQIAAAVLIVFAAVRFVQRRKKSASSL